MCREPECVPVEPRAETPMYRRLCGMHEMSAVVVYPTDRKLSLGVCEQWNRSILQGNPFLIS